MKKSLRIGTAFRIPLFLHWTFLLIPAYFMISAVLMGRPPLAVLADLTLITVIFVCVVLHEVGHALAARRFGVQTRDIILMPIGGVARLERIPKHPGEELLIALAGPGVNAGIVVMLMMITLPFTGLNGLIYPTSPYTSFIGKTVAVNLAMIVFNMLPAFPMDGGRVLRAILSMQIGHLRATRMAASVGQAMAICLGLAGLFLFNNLMLVFIAGFVYLGAAQEVRTAAIESSVEGISVRDVMTTRFDTIPAQATANWAFRYAIGGDRPELPVVSDGNFKGMLRVEDAAEAVVSGNDSTPVLRICRTDVDLLRDDVPLLSVIQQLQAAELTSLPVVSESGTLVGLITRSSIRSAQRFGSLVRSSGEVPPPSSPDSLRRSFAQSNTITKSEVAPNATGAEVEVVSKAATL